MENEAVSNSGPVIHLSEIDLLNAFNIFKKIVIPEEVSNELKKRKVDIPQKIKILQLRSESKDFVKILTNQQGLDSGESEAISLTLQEKANYFLTDDLDARNVAEDFNIEVHGTMGIILRAFREKLLNKPEVIKKIRELKTISSLFITQDLIDETINSIEKFRD